jgi:hypothetical protein
MSAAPSPAMLGRGGEAGGTDTTDPRPKRGSVTSLLILSLFVFIMTNNGSNDDLAARNQYRDTLSSLEWQFGNYSAWLSGSDDTNFVLVRLPHVCLAFLSYAPNPNISIFLMISRLGHRVRIVSYPTLYPTAVFSILSFNLTIPI